MKKVKRKDAVRTLRTAKSLIERGFGKGSWIRANRNVESRSWSPPGLGGEDKLLRDLIPDELLNANQCFVCGEGAIYLAAAHEGLTYGQARELIREVAMETPHGSIPEYNDGPGTKVSVANLIERTAKRIDIEEPV